MTETSRLLRSLADEVFGSLASAPDREPVELEPGWDAIRELDWPLVAIAEAAGGAGGELEDALELAEGLGRNAMPLPLLTAHCAYASAAAAGRRDLLSRRLVVETVPQTSCLEVVDGGGTARITGTAQRVPWARHADVILVRLDGDGDGGRRWLVCSPNDSAVTITPGVNLAGEPRDDIRFSGLSVVAADQWTGLPDSIIARGMLLRCAAVVGAIEATVALTAQYVAEREQFGRPLLAMQSVGQQIGMMIAQLSAARSAVDAGRRSQTIRNAVAAHVDVAGYAHRTARTVHDLHGAMGVAAEYPLHRLTKRLWAWPEEGIRQDQARRELGADAVARGERALWSDLIS